MGTMGTKNGEHSGHGYRMGTQTQYTYCKAPHRYVGTVHVGVIYLVVGVDGFGTDANVIVGPEHEDEFDAGF